MHLSQKLPIVFSDSVSDKLIIYGLKKNGVRVVDFLSSQINEARRIPFISGAIEKYSPDELGNWIFFPWRNLLTRILIKEIFLQVKTSRNLFLLSKVNQKEYLKLKIGIAGMTVGSAIAKSLVLETCGSCYKLADNDNIAISNLNRLDAGVCDLEKPKVYLASEKLFEINPYLSIEVFQKGITRENINRFFLNPKLDIIIEEVDDLAVKVLLRKYAKKNNVPLLMATALDSIVLIDYEAYGRGKNVSPFHGALNEHELKSLSSVSIKKKAAGATKIIPEIFFSERLKKSFRELGKSINAFPQLASGTFFRAACVTYFVRQLMINKRDINSGRYIMDLETLFK